MDQIERLREIVADLRNPEGGCPWDLEQDFDSIAPHTIEEAYEVADAIERKDYPELKAELGDLLLQVVFHSQMAAEQQLFDFNAVVADVCTKLVHRHPHVFGQAKADTAADVLSNWEDIKAEERAGRAKSGLLDDVARNLPALLRAQKLQKRAGRVGLDWDSPEPVLGKLLEEIEELCEVLAVDADNEQRLADELGDVLFTTVNLARKLGFEAEDLMRASNSKFEKRIQSMEAHAAKQGRHLADLDDAALDELWETVKASQA